MFHEEVDDVSFQSTKKHPNFEIVYFSQKDKACLCDSEFCLLTGQ